MDEREILRTAARLSASRRRRVRTTCAVCGREVEGTTRRRYCSNACKLRAARQQHRAAVAVTSDGTVPPLVARLDATAVAIARGRVFEDSAGVIREAREERAAGR